MKEQSTSCNFLSFEEAMRKLHEPYSCLEQVHATEHVALSPKSIGCAKDLSCGIKTILDAKLNKYSSKYGGIPVAYSNVTCLGSAGKIVAGSPVVHFNIMLDFIIFKGQIGSLVQGIINKKNVGYLGVVVHNICNAAVEQRPTCRLSFEEGEKITFKITEIATMNYLPVIKGVLADNPRVDRATEESFHVASTSDGTGHGKVNSPKKNLQNPESSSLQAESPNQSLNLPISQSRPTPETEHVLEGSLGSDVTKKKRKRSGSNKSATVTEVEIDTGNSTVDIEHQESKRKRKRSHLADASIDSNASTPVCDGILNGTVEKKRNHEYSDNVESAGANGVVHDSVNESVATEKKKKKKNHSSCGETVGNESVVATSGDQTETSGKKKKSKQELKNEVTEEPVDVEPAAKSRKEKKKKRDSCGEVVSSVASCDQTKVPEKKKESELMVKTEGTEVKELPTESQKEKKKKKRSSKIEAATDTSSSIATNDSHLNEISGHKKKNKNTQEVKCEPTEGGEVEVSAKSEKRKKKKRHSSQVAIDLST